MRWLVLLIALLATPCAAGVVNPGDPVPGHPGLTYLDLLRQGLPTLAANAADNGAVQGHLPTPPPRRLGGGLYEGEAPDPVVLGWMQDLRIVADGRKRMVLLADLGPDPDRAQSQTLLLLFDDASRPRLLDMADVGIDRDTEFDERQPVIRLGPGDDALMTVSEHNDADISYDGHILLFVRHDRFQRIADFFLINSRSCGWEQDERLDLVSRPAPRSPYSSVDIRVSYQIKRGSDEGCGDPIPKARTRRFDAVFRWNPRLGGFATTSRALTDLAAVNGMSP